MRETLQCNSQVITLRKSNVLKINCSNKKQRRRRRVN